MDYNGNKHHLSMENLKLITKALTGAREPMYVKLKKLTSMEI